MKNKVIFSFLIILIINLFVTSLIIETNHVENRESNYYIDINSMNHPKTNDYISTQYISPSQPENFTVNKGNLNVPYGDLSTNDGDLSTISPKPDVDAPLTTERLRPDGDISINNWVYDGPNLYDEIDEENFDSDVISCSTDLGSFIVDFSSVNMGSGALCTKIIVTARYNLASYVGLYACYRIGDSADLGQRQFTYRTSYGYNSIGWQGLSLNQTQLNDLRLRIFMDYISSGSPPSIGIDQLYIDITYNRSYDIDVETQWKIEADNLVSIKNITCAYQITHSISSYYQIYNFTEARWDTIFNGIKNDFTIITTPLETDYIEDNSIKVRFISDSSASFHDLEIDMLKIEYTINIVTGVGGRGDDDGDKDTTNNINIIFIGIITGASAVGAAGVATVFLLRKRATSSYTRR